MISNLRICSNKTGPTKGPPQRIGSLSSPKDPHATSLIKLLIKNITSQRSSGQKTTLTSILGNDGSVWHPLDGLYSSLMAPLQKIFGKGTLAKHVDQPPPKPPPPPWPFSPRPWLPWPALNLSTSPRFSLLPAKVDPGRSLLLSPSVFFQNYQGCSVFHPPPQPSHLQQRQSMAPANPI